MQIWNFDAADSESLRRIGAVMPNRDKFCKNFGADSACCALLMK